MAKFVRFFVSMHIFYYYWVKKINRGIRYIEAHFIYVPLYNCSLKFVEKTNYKPEICEFLCYYRKQRGLNC